MIDSSLHAQIVANDGEGQGFRVGTGETAKPPKIKTAKPVLSLPKGRVAKEILSTN